MSETEYARLAAQLTRIADDMSDIYADVGVIKEKLTGYGDLKQQNVRHETAIQLINQRCSAIQEAKKSKTINWGAIAGYLIGAILFALILRYTGI